MIYYIADIHLRDESIFIKCKRPYNDIFEYEKELNLRWNKKVTPFDTVYVLGDIALEGCTEAIDIFSKLNGHKHLIIGNHDENLSEYIKRSGLFDSVNFISLISDAGRKVCLCHYPLMDWMEFNRNGYHVYGHVHNKTAANGEAYHQIKEYYKDKLAFNCGVDVVGFEPVTLNELIKLKEANRNEPYIN